MAAIVGAATGRYPEEWKARARCRGMHTDIFYPERGDNKGIAAAKAICALCPVRAECLEWALHQPYMADLGVVGGMSWRERKHERARRRARSKAVPDAS